MHRFISDCFFFFYSLCRLIAQRTQHATHKRIRKFVLYVYVPFTFLYPIFFSASNEIVRMWQWQLYLHRQLCMNTIKTVRLVFFLPSVFFLFFCFVAALVLYSLRFVFTGKQALYISVLSYLWTCVHFFFVIWPLM